MRVTTWARTVQPRRTRARGKYLYNVSLCLSSRAKEAIPDAAATLLYCSFENQVLTAYV
jgi:hypothetical protein